MRLFLDCEYNGFQGELISMALVDEKGEHWYEALPCLRPVPWIAKNVMPVIGIAPIPKHMFQQSLHHFLKKYPAIHVIADWPEDIAHFCQSLITGPGQRLDTPPLKISVVRCDAVSKTPHNALADARAIREHILHPRGIIQ